MTTQNQIRVYMTDSVQRIYNVFLADANERRDEAVSDTPVAHLSTTMDEFFLLEMVENQVNALVKINPLVSDHAAYEKGKKVLCLILRKNYAEIFS